MKPVLAFFVAFVVSALARPVLAQTYDPVADFSLSANSNVNGVWSYGFTPTRGGAFSLLANPVNNFLGNTNVESW